MTADVDVMGFVVLYNLQHKGKECLTEGVRGSVSLSLTYLANGGKMKQSEGRFMNQQPMPFCTITVSAYIDLFSAAGYEIKTYSWICVTLTPRHRTEIYEADTRLLRTHLCGATQITDY